MVFLGVGQRTVLKIASIDKSLIKHTLRFLKSRTVILKGRFHE